MQYIANFLTYFYHQGIFIQTLAILLLTGGILYIEKIAYRHISNQVHKTRNNWDKGVVRSVHKPLTLLIWVLSISYIADIVRIELHGGALYNAIGPIREIAIMIIIAWFLIRLIREMEWAYTHPGYSVGKRQLDQTTINALTQISRAGVITVSILISLQTLGYNISGLLTLGGVGGLVAGFAARDMLANFFGGMMIYFDRPFKVGDWVRSPERNIEGTVEHIGWRLCRIRTFDQRPLYVPNAVFSTISVENPSRMLNRRIYTTIGVRYEDATKVREIVSAIKTMLEQHENIDQRAIMIVNLVGFGTSSLNVMVYTFTRTTDWIRYQAIQEDVFLKIIDIISHHGARCAFPTTTLHIPETVNINQTTNQEIVNHEP